jgi:hypothetical protein
MSADNFDKKVRNKLESIEPEFNQEAWNKLKGFLPIVPWYVTFLRNYGAWLLGSAVSGLLLFTVYKYQNVKGENEILKSKIEKISPNSDKNIISHDTIYKYDTIFKTDTIVIYKTLNSQNNIQKEIVPSLVSSKNKSEFNSELKKQIVNTKPFEAIDQEGLKNKNFSQNDNIKNTISKTEIPVKTEDLKIKPVEEKNSKPELEFKTDDFKLKSEENSSSKIELVSETEELIIPKKSNSIINSEIVNPKTVKTKRKKKEKFANEEKGSLGKKENRKAEKSVKEKKFKKNENNIASETSKVEKSNIESEDFNNKIEEKDIVNKNVLSKNSNEKFENATKLEEKVNLNPENKVSNFRIGLFNVFAPMQQFSFGTITEFVFRRFGINTGLLYSVSSNNDFKEKEFDKKFGKPFNEKYDKLIDKKQPSPMVEEIHIVVGTIKMPLLLNYYFPIKAKFSIFTSLGTQFDLSVSEKIKYDDFSNGTHKEVAIKNQPKAKFFNNLNFGAGLQYESKHFVWQTNPYFETYFNKPNDFSKSSNIGFMTSMKYKFNTKANKKK